MTKPMILAALALGAAACSSSSDALPDARLHADAAAADAAHHVDATSVLDAASPIDGNRAVDAVRTPDAQPPIDAVPVVDANVIDAASPASLSANTPDFESVTIGGAETPFVHVVNSGGTDATNVTYHITGTDAAHFSLSGQCSVIAAGQQCQLSPTFGPFSSGATFGAYSAVLTISFQATAATTLSTYQIPLDGLLGAQVTATFTPSITSTSGFASGDGSQGNPLSVVDTAAEASVTVTYANLSNTFAVEFSLDSQTLQPWTMQSTTCDTVDLDQITGTCTATFVISDWQADGEADLDLAQLVTASWRDAAGPPPSGAYTDQTIPGLPVIYATVAP